MGFNSGFKGLKFFILYTDLKEHAIYYYCRKQIRILKKMYYYNNFLIFITAEVICLNVTCFSYILQSVCGSLVVTKQWKRGTKLFTAFLIEVTSLKPILTTLEFDIKYTVTIKFPSKVEQKISAIPTSSNLSTLKPSIHPFLYIVSLEGHLEFIISLNMHDTFTYFQWSIFPHKTLHIYSVIQCILLHTHTTHIPATICDWQILW